MKALLRSVLAGIALVLTGNACQLMAQSSATTANPAPVTSTPSSDLDLKIPSSQPWTDTGLELHPGDVLEISSAAPALAGGGSPCASGNTAASAAKDLQLSSAPVGALVGKLHSQGAESLLIGEKKEIKIEEQGHLFLAVNAGNPPVCEETLAVKVHVTSAVVGQTTAPPKDIKSKLAAAAQTWIAGQFGGGTPTTGASAVTSDPATPASSAAPANGSAASVRRPLNISTAPLDPKLRDAIDHLPRRVNDQLKNLGDMVNFVMLGSQKDVGAALQSANWFVADTSNSGAVTKAILMTYENKDYLQMPMSQLYLFGRVQDFGYEQAEPYSVVASRHHFRLWKAPFQLDGKDVWVGAGTHDVGFEKDQRNGSVTHKIDPAVDGERDHIATSLEKTGMVQTLSYYLPANPVQEAKNATGGGYHSDGRVLVMWIKPTTNPTAATNPK